MEGDHWLHNVLGGHLEARSGWLCSSSCIVGQRISSQARALKSWCGWQDKCVSFSCVTNRRSLLCVHVPETERNWDQPYAAGRYERSEAGGGILL